MAYRWQRFECHSHDIDGDLMKKDIIQTLHDIRDSAQPLGKGELKRARRRFMRRVTLKRFTTVLATFMLGGVMLSGTSQTYYLPLIQAGGAQASVIATNRSILDYGAVGDGITDSTNAIQAAIDAGVGMVMLPPGEYAVSRTIVVSGSGVTLQGSGIGQLGYMWGTPPTYSGATVLKWVGATGGTLLRIGDGIEPNAGNIVRDMVLDGANQASRLIVADATYYLKVDNIAGYRWRDGYAITITHSRGVRGAGEKFHTWDHLTFVNPYQNGSGIDIAPEGSLNINQISINNCNITRSNVDDYTVTSLRLGYVDHISFYRCVFMPSISAHDWSQAGGQYVRHNPYAITVQPVKGHRTFPTSVTFYGTSIYGGINYINTVNWIRQAHSALLFYPFYSSDGQRIPPSGFINGQAAGLPAGMVGGYTDTGVPLK